MKAKDIRAMRYAKHDRRAMKRHEGVTASGFRAYEAYILGQMAAEHEHCCYIPKRLRQNPYPPGRRHNEWLRGFMIGPNAEEHGFR